MSFLQSSPPPTAIQTTVPLGVVFAMRHGVIAFFNTDNNRNDASYIVFNSKLVYCRCASVKRPVFAF